MQFSFTLSVYHVRHCFRKCLSLGNFFVKMVFESERCPARVAFLAFFYTLQGCKNAKATVALTKIIICHLFMIGRQVKLHLDAKSTNIPLFPYCFTKG